MGHLRLEPCLSDDALGFLGCAVLLALPREALREEQFEKTGFSFSWDRVDEELMVLVGEAIAVDVWGCGRFEQHVSWVVRCCREY